MSTMSNPDFTIEVPAKWVLAGEHSVLRGKRALAFPHPDLGLSLFYWDSLAFRDDNDVCAEPILKLIARACEFVKLNPEIFTAGKIRVESRIPMGAGLGSSAALSVAVARLVLWKANAPLDLWIPLATHLEDVFHGKSSGMDVSVIVHAVPVVFSMKEKVETRLTLKTLPRFQFQDSGKRGQTKICIEQVNQWRALNPALADAFDQQMGDATETAIAALNDFHSDPARAELVLKDAMENAQACFETWGLVSDELLEQKRIILEQGALAVRLTGSGLGGFWVSLWQTT